MSLISKIYQAVLAKQLPERFTTSDIHQWVADKNIRKKDGSKYAESSVRSIGANSNLKNRPTTNKNIKMLRSEITNKITHYYFADGD